MTVVAPSLRTAAESYAELLGQPEPAATDEPWAPQSLTKGAAGIALLHIERAHNGCGSWRQAHRWITNAAAGEISASDTAGLFLGAPAITFMFDAAAAGSAERYPDALADLDKHIAALAHRRVDAATARISAGGLPGFREYDVFFGLTGIGALLLRRNPGGSATERVLSSLVALTRPRRIDDHLLPGWWVGHDPHRRDFTANQRGHANFGMAHGIAGPLALLSKAMRQTTTVDGHREAIATICDWLDAWRQDSENGPWWPEWITVAELDSHRPHQPGPARPSWCYGTPGIARAGQLAAIALGDTDRRRTYELALARCLADPTQQTRIRDGGLCHGWAGVYQTVWRAASDASTPVLVEHLPRLAENLARSPASDVAARRGFVDGTAGIALALHTAAHNTAPISGWDACLLID